MSSIQKYYSSVTKKIISSKYIYSNHKKICSLNNGTFVLENLKPSLVQTLTYFLVVKNKPSVLRSLTPSNIAVAMEKKDENDKRQSTFKPKRVKVLNHLANKKFEIALKKWLSLDRHWPMRHKKHEKKIRITPKYISITNWQMPFFYAIDKSEEFNLIHDIPKRASISFSLKMQRGSLSSRLFLINKLKLMRR